MSVCKLTATLLMTLATTGLVHLGLAKSVCAQYPTTPHANMPPADPFAFDPDFQWFKPVYDADLADMKPKKRANTGWFATYDRLALYTSRPELDDPRSAETKLDRGWGHRYEIGYMIPDTEHGFSFTWTDMNSNKYFTVAHERLNRINEDALDPDGAGGTVDPRFGFVLPRGDDNNPGLNQRIVFEQDTENVVSYDAYELNKTWRMEPYHYGGILEPLVGFRWGRIEDLNAFQEYRSTADLLEPPFVDDPNDPNDPVDILGDNFERLTTNMTFTENEVLAGQIGFRYIKFRDRFTYSADFRVFMGGALQCAKTLQAIEYTAYDGDGTGSAVDRVVNSITTPVYTRNEEFVAGFDLRGQLAYQLTKLVKVRGGFQLIDYGTGIWRGGPNTGILFGGDQDQDLVMVGGTFGIELNR